ncbi:hypothetical protein IIC45_01740 [Patescibacteria group bacterium]|nr:hypothetical protein [Patescibacteria group bacterium]
MDELTVLAVLYPEHVIVYLIEGILGPFDDQIARMVREANGSGTHNRPDQDHGGG